MISGEIDITAKRSQDLVIQDERHVSRPIVAICSMCNRVRNEVGEYVSRESLRDLECAFSHTLCPDCLQLYYSTL